MDAQELHSLQEAYLDVYEELGEAFTQTKVPLSVRQNAEANRVGSKRFSDLGGHAALKAGGGQAALNSGSSVSNTIQAGRQALNTKSRQNFNNRVLSKPSTTQAKKPMDDFAAGGGNAKMKATGMTKDQVIAQGKKNLVNSYEPDLFDVILEYLVAEGYADTNENALVIMANMSEEWRESIVEAEVLAAKGGVPGTMKVKPTQQGGFLGIGARTVNKPVPGSFTPKDVSSIDAARYNNQVDKNFTRGGDNTDSASARTIQRRAKDSGHSGYMNVKNPGSIPDTGIPNRPSPGRASDQNQARKPGWS